MNLLGRTAVAALSLLLFTALLEAGSINVYYDRTAWETAMNQKSGTVLTNISFADSLWSSSTQNSAGFTGLLSESNSAASNGMSVSIDSGFSAPGWAATSTLGQVVNGVWTDHLTKYGSTTFDFGDPIYGFGGDFDIAWANGLFFNGVGTVGGGTSAYDGFIGIVSDQPLDSLMISWGLAGNVPDLFGNSYTLNNVEVEALPIPEPSFRWTYVMIPIAATGYFGYSRFRTWCRFLGR